MNGWIKLSRALLKWRYKNSPNYVALWIHILLMANHEPQQWKNIDTQKGEFITSVDELAKGTGLSTQQVRTILKNLNGQELTIKSTNKYTLIKVNKWEEYQCDSVETNKETNKQITNKQQTNNKQITNTLYNKNERMKESKNINIYSSKKFTKPTINEIEEYMKANNYTSVDPEEFIDFYESKGWLVGKTPMKDWKATVRRWEKNNKNTKVSTEVIDTSKERYGKWWEEM